MGVYAVTGSASGMGRAAAEQLRADGHTVIGVDQRDADVVADLATPRGRADAAAAVLDRVDGRLDGAVLAAGVGPLPGAENVRLILSVNYFGVTELLDAWRPVLAGHRTAHIAPSRHGSVRGVVQHRLMEQGQRHQRHHRPACDAGCTTRGSQHQRAAHGHQQQRHNDRQRAGATRRFRLVDR